MALSTFTKKVYAFVTTGSIGGSAAVLSTGLLTNPSISNLSVATGALGVAALGAATMYAHDTIGKKLAVWDNLRLSKASISLDSWQEVWSMALELQAMEHTIDHRLNAIEDSNSKEAVTAMGAWVHAALNVLDKGSLITTALVLGEHGVPRQWPEVSKNLISRVDMYDRMLTHAKVLDLPATQINIEH